MLHANQLRSGGLGVFVLLYVLATSLALADNRSLCGDVQACIRKIPDVATPGGGITMGEQQLARAIHGYGGAAVPGVLPYLKDPRKNVRDLASFILRDQPGLSEEHLPALMESRLRGDGWIPPAIARIGTPKAIAFLVSELKKEPETHTQLTWAFRVLGPRAGPALVELYRCGTQCDARLLGVCEFIFGELKEQAIAIVPDLKAIALDRNQPLIARRAAVNTLGVIGPSAASVASELQILAANHRADFGESVDHALIGMGHPGAITGLLNRIEHGDDLAFVYLAKLGYAGKGAGPAIVKYLDDPDRVVYAARTLGYIGYSEATEPLERFLRSDDWQVDYVTCESLGQLKAAGARGEIERAMRNHWYPPVRDAARAALGAIDGKEEHKEDSSLPSTFQFFAYEHAGDKLCKSAQLDANNRNDSLNVPGGQLFGIDHGEWGGELRFVDSATKQPSKILDGNIMGVFQMGSRLVAIGGLAHLSINYGNVYAITNDHGHYSATVWRRLPGAPRGGRLQKDGRLLIDTYGGQVFVNGDGTMEMAPCDPQRD
jgi:HEAT repeat protein